MSRAGTTAKPATGAQRPAAAPRRASRRRAGAPLGRAQRVRSDETRLLVNVSRVVFPLRGSGAATLPGERVAGVLLTVRNVGDGVYDSSSEGDVSLRASGSAAVEPAFAGRGRCATTEIDPLKQLAPGVERSACIVFALPQGARPRTVRFAPDGRRSRARTWRVG